MGSDAMVWIKLSDTVREGRDINLPDSLAHRSVEGNTLILTPGRSQEVTREEWEHIQSCHADLLPAIEVLSS